MKHEPKNVEFSVGRRHRRTEPARGRLRHIGIGRRW
jgi:hypothetical protein